MTTSAPTAETIRLITKIVSAQAPSIAELPETILILRRTFAELLVPPTPVPAPVVRARVGRPRIVREVVPVQIPPRKRGRPRLNPLSTSADEKRRRRPITVTAVEPVEVEPEPPPAPRLLRRAAVTSSPEPKEPLAAPAPSYGTQTLHGVVKWFDARSGRGALRLAGISADVAIEPNAMERSGVKRLYKDQEVEATVELAGTRSRLVSLALPTRKQENGAGPSDVPGVLRRSARPVTVEVKRDGHRRHAARAEAEQILGGDKAKPTRRLTP